ncbi:hypothetical protein D1159_03640 [Pseudoflavonifractor sp. 524-17]|uniref:hypothetical protein n=1 Tax=Pseudoflavonifractor sp. 524-17 TaxID=2304577 RepID=UPI00137B444D|nr:hypothetical protein [Pseudoflavonifractor sp. 524-17]NCE63692.1 hypothetical protein [Pseudoflavonifractor sp. 524-17]
MKYIARIPQLQLNCKWSGVMFSSWGDVQQDEPRGYCAVCQAELYQYDEGDLCPECGAEQGGDDASCETRMFSQDREPAAAADLSNIPVRHL